METGNTYIVLFEVTSSTTFINLLLTTLIKKIQEKPRSVALLVSRLKSFCIVKLPRPRQILNDQQIIIIYIYKIGCPKFIGVNWWGLGHCFPRLNDVKTMKKLAATY